MIYSKLLICLSICSITLFSTHSSAVKPKENDQQRVNTSLTYANSQLDKFTNSVSKRCSTIKCSYTLFDKEHKRLDKQIKVAYKKDDVGYTYYTMSMESLCNNYMKTNKELDRSFKEKICLVKYSYGQLKYMGVV